MTKAEVYMHTEQFEKALFFMQQGAKIWGEEYYLEYTFNQGLLYYLTGEYEKSLDLYQNLFDYAKNADRNVETLRGVAFNLMMCLLRK